MISGNSRKVPMNLRQHESFLQLRKKGKKSKDTAGEGEGEETEREKGWTGGKRKHGMYQWSSGSPDELLWDFRLLPILCPELHYLKMGKKILLLPLNHPDKNHNSENRFTQWHLKWKNETEVSYDQQTQIRKHSHQLSKSDAYLKTFAAPVLMPSTHK